MSGVTVTVNVSPCCDRLQYLSSILAQAKNLCLNENYIIAIEDIILTIVPLIKANNHDAVVVAYDDAIDNILSLRDSAFTDLMNDVKNLHTPIPKTPGDTPMQEIKPVTYHT